MPLIGLLSGLGLLTIWRLSPDLGLRQTIWIIIAGVIAFIGFQFPDILHYLRRYKYLWLFSGLMLTGLTIIFGENPTGAGPKLWLQILGVYFQPSEPLKLLLIAYLAAYFTDRLAVQYRFFESFFPTILITGMALLLLVSQQDLGTGIIFLLIYLAMLYTAQGKKYILWIAPLLILLAGVMGYLFIDIVQVRINTWLTPFADPSGAAYQVIQSMIAIAEGQLLGTGPGLGSPGLIPVAVSDFIFSAIAEEIGFLGVAGLILMYIFLIYRGVRISILTKKTFHRYLSLGITFYFGIQSILIIGGNIGLLPLTGVTLPFVSYGGSSLVISFAALVLLMTISQTTEQEARDIIFPQPRFAFISSLLIIMLFIEILVTSILSIWQSPSLISRVENPRWVVYDRFVPRGEILDQNNLPIITNTGEVGQYTRNSHHIPLYPVVGYTNSTYGQTGIESTMYPYLRGYEGYPFKTIFWHDYLYNQPPEGLAVRLTLNLNIQKTADELLGQHNGAVIVMNADSGEILTMASHPYFDAASLDEQWDNLIGDEDAPLVNRATQGVYPPGANLLPFLLTLPENRIKTSSPPLALLPSGTTLSNCSTFLHADDTTWQIIAESGCVDIQTAIAESVERETRLNLYTDLGFYKEPEIRLSVAEIETLLPENLSTLPLTPENDIKISPLQMAAAASAITHQGIRPSPRIVNGYQSPEGVWISLPKLDENNQVIPANQAAAVQQLLEVPGANYWQALSYATTEDNDIISWFVGGTTETWQGQPITVVIVLESEDLRAAEEIGHTLFHLITQ